MSWTPAAIPSHCTHPTERGGGGGRAWGDCRTHLPGALVPDGPIGPVQHAAALPQTPVELPRRHPRGGGGRSPWRHRQSVALLPLWDRRMMSAPKQATQPQRLVKVNWLNVSNPAGGGGGRPRPSRRRWPHLVPLPGGVAEGPVAVPPLRREAADVPVPVGMLHGGLCPPGGQDACPPP